MENQPQMEEQYAVLLKTVFPPMVLSSLEQDPRNPKRCGAWRYTVYGLTQPQDITNLKWKYKHPLRSLDKRHCSYRISVRGVLVNGGEKVHADTAGLSKPQSFSIASKLIHPVGYGSQSRNKGQQELLTGLWIPWEPANETDLVTETAVINSISLYDESTFHRQYYYPTRRSAQEGLQERVDKRCYFKDIPALEERWQDCKSTRASHNEVLARAKWICSSKHALVCYNHASLPSRLLLLIRKADFLRRLRQWHKEEKKSFPEDYKIPLKFYKGADCHDDYDEKMQEKDLRQADASADNLVSRLNLFIKLQQQNYQVDDLTEIPLFIKNIKWLAATASSLTFESSHDFYTNFIAQYWCDISRYMSENMILGDRFKVYGDIFKCVHPEKLFGIFQALYSFTNGYLNRAGNVQRIQGFDSFFAANVERIQVFDSFFAALEDSGYMIKTEELVIILEMCSAYGISCKKSQNCINKHLLKAMEEANYSEARKLMELGAQANCYEQAPNKILALPLAITHGQKQLAIDMIGAGGVGKEEKDQASYFLVRSMFFSFSNDKVDNDNSRLAYSLVQDFEELRERALRFSIKINDERCSLAIIQHAVGGKEVFPLTLDTLMLAAVYDAEKIFREMLKKGVNVTLLSRAIVSVCAFDNNYYLRILLSDENADVAGFRVRAEAYRSLSLAVWRDNCEAVALLCKAGINITKGSRSGDSIIDLAIIKNNEELLWVLFENTSMTSSAERAGLLKLAMLLLKDDNQTVRKISADRWECLILAAAESSRWGRLVYILGKCKVGVNVDRLCDENDGRTSLHLAIRYRNHQGVALLCHAGANIQACDYVGTSAIDMVVDSNDVCLLKIICDSIKDTSVLSIQHLYKLMKACLRLNASDLFMEKLTASNRKDILEYATQELDFEFITFLLSVDGFNVDEQAKLMVLDAVCCEGFDIDDAYDLLIGIAPQSIADFLKRKFNGVADFCLSDYIICFNFLWSHHQPIIKGLLSDEVFVRAYLSKLNQQVCQGNYSSREERPAIEGVLLPYINEGYLQRMQSLIKESLTLNYYKLPDKILAAKYISSKRKYCVLSVTAMVRSLRKNSRLSSLTENIASDIIDDINLFSPQDTLGRCSVILKRACKSDITVHRGCKLYMFIAVAVMLSLVVGTLLGGGLITVPLLAALSAKLTVAGCTTVFTLSAMATQCGLFSIYNRVKNKKLTVRPMTNTHIAVNKIRHRVDKVRRAISAPRLALK